MAKRKSSRKRGPRLDNLRHRQAPQHVIERFVPTLAALAASWHARRRGGAGVERARFGYGAAERSTAARRPHQPGRVWPRRSDGGSVRRRWTSPGCCHRLRRPGVHPAVRWTVRRPSGVLSCSWPFSCTDRAGRFSGTPASFSTARRLLFWSLNGLQIYHWVYPPLAVAVLVATLVGSAVLGWWVPRWISSQAAGRATDDLSWRRAARLAICVVAALAGRMAYASETDRTRSTQNRLRREPRRSCGPGRPCLRRSRQGLHRRSPRGGVNRQRERDSPADHFDGPVSGRRPAGRDQALERRDGADRVAALGPASRRMAERATSCRRLTRSHANPACSRTRTSRRAIPITRTSSRCRPNIRSARRRCTSTRRTRPIRGSSSTTC